MIPRLIDFRSLYDAKHVCISYSAPGTSRCTDITYKGFGHAVNNVVWTFSNAIGARHSSSEPTKVVSILAPRYVIFSALSFHCHSIARLDQPRVFIEVVQNILAWFQRVNKLVIV